MTKARDGRNAKRADAGRALHRRGDGSNPPVTETERLDLHTRLDHDDDDDVTTLLDKAVDIDQSIYTELENIGYGDGTGDPTPLTDSLKPAVIDAHVRREIEKVMGKALRSGEVLRRAERRHALEHETKE